MMNRRVILEVGVLAWFFGRVEKHVALQQTTGGDGVKPV